jgi:hypothetical protein
VGRRCARRHALRSTGAVTPNRKKLRSKHLPAEKSKFHDIRLMPPDVDIPSPEDHFSVLEINILADEHFRSNYGVYMLYIASKVELGAFYVEGGKDGQSSHRGPSNDGGSDRRTKPYGIGPTNSHAALCTNFMQIFILWNCFHAFRDTTTHVLSQRKKKFL